MSGILYVIGTPIGNFKDTTARALKLLTECDILLAEDTRVTKKLLDHFQIDKKLFNYHQHSDENKKYEILKYLVEGKNVALVTDAGTPGLSDPGNELIEFILERDSSIQIVPIPGASSLTSAISVCGFNMQSFVFGGYLPKKGANKILDQSEKNRIPCVFFTSPNRIIKDLEKIETVVGKDREIFIAREMTKLYETFYRGNTESLIGQLSKQKVKGELVVIIDKASV